MDIAKGLHSSSFESIQRGCSFVKECSVYPKLIEYEREDDIGGTSFVDEDSVYITIRDTNGDNQWVVVRLRGMLVIWAKKMGSSSSILARLQGWVVSPMKS